jgi:hypothetical protein
MTKGSSANQQTLEFQLELMMVHLEQMNKRLDMLEKTCVSLMEKNNAPPAVCPYHAAAQQHLEKRIQHDLQQEQKQQHQQQSQHSNSQSSISNRTSLQRRAAM